MFEKRNIGEVLLFEEDSFHRKVLARFLKVCGLKVRITNDPKQIIRFASLMNPEGMGFLIINLASSPQLGMILLDKIKLIRNFSPQRAFVIVDMKDSRIGDKMKSIGYPNFIDISATPEQVAETINKVYYQGEKSRKFVRVFTHLPCEIIARDQKAQAMITNISMGGAFIESEKLLEKGYDLTLRITLEEGSVILGKALVTYLIRKPVYGDVSSRPGMGIRFTHLNEAGKPLLEKFLKDVLESTLKESEAEQG